MARIKRKLEQNKYEAALTVAREYRLLRLNRYKNSESKLILSERFRCSRSTIESYLKVLKSTTYLKRLIKEELIPFGVANKIIFTSKERQDEIARKAYLNKLTQSEVGLLIKENSLPKDVFAENGSSGFIPGRDVLNHIERLVEHHGVSIKIHEKDLNITLSTYDPKLGRDLMWSGGFINSNLRCETTTSDIIDPLIALKIVLYASNHEEMEQAISLIFNAFSSAEKLVIARDKILKRKAEK
jgi:hypothetical protein